MVIAIDKYIPFAKGLLDNVADVRYLAPDEFTPSAVKDADALIIRTRTKCDRDLLDGSNVKFIATATIGYDHIDTKYCESKGIVWTNAPGCNANSVCNYIDAAIRYAMPDFKGKSLGIVGVGNVGERVRLNAINMGMKTILCDPPRALKEPGTLDFRTLDEVAASSDIITFHVPLDSVTTHMISSLFLAKCKSDAIIINAARGAILDTKAALDASQRFIIDCWEGEPDINLQLLYKTILGTPHIAGYSIDGKANGTIMSANALSKFFGLGVTFTKESLNLPPKDFTHPYNIKCDSDALRANPSHFEHLRNHYPVRRDLIEL